MKYLSSNTKRVHDIDFTKKGRYTCPECSIGSKRKNPLDLEYFPDTDRAFCHKCKTSYFLYKPYSKQKEYKIPERKNNTQLRDKALKYWEGRMISQKTLNDLGIYSDEEYMPQFEKVVPVICFPFVRAGQLVNIKYRGPKKSFKLVSGAELIWYNFDVIEGNTDIIICEGEGEVLTWQENGFKNAISVPNGAGGNVNYLDGCIELFDNVERAYLATDNDTKGIELREELARRIGPEKCLIISFQECKDGNEFFCKYGGMEFKKLLDEAMPIPIKGIVTVDHIKADILNLRENGVQRGQEIGMEEIDKYISWELRRVAIGTGMPASGKSELVDFITVKLNLHHGWKIAYFTPENYPLHYHYAKLHEKLSGSKFLPGKDAEFWSIYEYIRENFYYILNEEDFTFDAVLDAVKVLIKQHGIKVVVLDPYNRFEHAQASTETETQYISKFLDKITLFAKIYNVLIILVAHPKKMHRGDIPNLYDISGSANFYNKCDYGFTVHRERDENGLMTNEVCVYWQKIRFKHLGEQGVSMLRYNYNNGRYEDRVSVDQWDNSCWLTPAIARQEMNEITETKEIFDGNTNTDATPF